MPDDDIGDWRIEAAATLAKDVPAAYPGGPSHKAGAHVYLSHVVKPWVVQRWGARPRTAPQAF